MYYILNHTNQIIAADNTLLQYLNLNTLEEFTRGVIFNELEIILSTDNTLQIHTHIENKILDFKSETTSLNSMFGNLNLVQLIPLEKTISDEEDKHTLDKTTPVQEDLSTLVIPNTINATIDEITLDDLDIKNDLSFVKEDMVLPSIENTPITDTEDIPLNPLDNQEQNEEEPFIKSEEVIFDTPEDILSKTLSTEDTLSSEEISLDTLETEQIQKEESFVKSEEIFLEPIKDPLSENLSIESTSEDISIPEEISLENKEIKKEEDFIKSEETSLEKSNFNQSEDSNIVSNETVEKISFDEDVSINTEPIIIHLNEVSNQIGISTDDYTSFLNEYIDTAISLESELQNTDTNIRNNAMETLMQLADVLQLPQVNNIISTLKGQSPEESQKTIEVFYNVLARVTTKIDADKTSDITQEEITINLNEDITLKHSSNIKEDSKIATPEIDLKQHKDTEEIKIYPVENTSLPSIENFKIADNTKSIDLVEVKEDSIPTPHDNNTNKSNQGFGQLQLKDIKPIHFDFQLAQAANDLMLPVELIEEFVHDFINQAHNETTKMLIAYEKGDLDAIQKIGHLLKGASSNLRISALSDTLYEIQFCEDSTKLEKLIKQYWGQFLSFEQQINTLSR